MTKRKRPGKREPNGQLSRKQADRTARSLDGLDQEQREALSVATEARQRVHGVDPKHQRDQMAGSYIGRLCLMRMISPAQYDAAMTWLEDCHNYRRAIAGAVGRQPGAIDLNATPGTSGYENVAKVQLWRKRYKDASKAVQDKQNELRGTVALFAALNHIVERDLSLEHMVGDCRTALNALARHYLLTSAAEAA